MDQTIRDIIEALRSNEQLEDKELDRILRKNSARVHDGRQRIAKKHVLPYYLSVKEKNPELWESWNIDSGLEQRFVSCVRMKPRRTASGVATITVISKPWPCAGFCICCPNDVRMPKSYLHDEPACQRAERSFFDPYLQVSSRLGVLELMGHTTDKVEMIVLGGNWMDYPEDYRLWFATELFRALNDSCEDRRKRSQSLRAAYASSLIPYDPFEIAQATSSIQDEVNQGTLTYNEAVMQYYQKDSPWASIENTQTSTMEALLEVQKINESSEHRMVGLVFEMRPDSISVPALTELRTLGCTKVQIGIQSIRPKVLEAMNRLCTVDRMRESICLVRLFGFKIHEHIMANLPGSTPKEDAEEFERIMSDPALVPDEIKLYPCSLVDGTGLMSLWQNGLWRPYSEGELIDLLAHDTVCTPPYVRISRMVRDIGAQDIVVGNKKANLRQDVEEALSKSDSKVREIRQREIAKDEACMDAIHIEDISYTTDVSEEHFLQWVDDNNRIYGFLRLSLPYEQALSLLDAAPPITPGHAMIREVHVYGFAESLGAIGSSAQHQGLGRKLIERACSIARDAGYSAINVISAVGTRNYYRNLGFTDCKLYQTRLL